MNESKLQAYLSSEYQGEESFLETIIFPIFGEENYETAWQLPVLEDEELQGMAARTGIKDIIKYGTISVGHVTIDIFDVTVSDSVKMQRNRVGTQQLVRRIMNTYSSAFIIFHYKDNWQLDWRFSFCQKDDKSITEAKRYTFLLGPGQSCRTAAQNFMKLLDKNGNVQRDDIVKAFDVEALSKEFFNKYKEHYERFCTYVYNNKQNPELFGEEFTEWEDKTIRDYVKKLLGRIVFLHFLQKKGWMGVPAGKPWGEGDRQFMKSLFENATDEQKANYLDSVLEPLFAEALDIDRKSNDDLFDCGVEAFRNVKVPYLNGGLFERDNMDEPKSTFSSELFANLFDFLYQYNFTIDENDPNDAQVGVDPEMLGRIFENLLEDNKDKGAFYTPKEIVQYMCRESLIAYLQTGETDEGTKDTIRQFVTTYDASLLTEEQKTTLNEKLQNVKICDPAIGSGAFPMGMLRELFFCRSAIEGLEDKQAANIKKHIIQQNIYGVDIEKGAVDIARLRFWLTLIIDEETPHALPNLDFKIMQGNSLLEQYEGVNLSGLAKGQALGNASKKRIIKSESDRKGKKGLDNSMQMGLLFDKATAIHNIQSNLSAYYSQDDHSKRQEMREAINAAVHEYIKETLPPDSPIIDEVDDLPLENDKFFLWHTWFSEVFEGEKPGFDIVIGNPPYIKEYENKRAFNGFRETSPYYMGKMDIWYGFACHGIDLLKPKGILTFIAQNNWTTSAGAKIMRKKVSSDTCIVQLVDFHDYMVFEDASIQTMVMLFRHDNNKATYTFDNRGLLDKSNKTDFLSLLESHITEKTYYRISLFDRVQCQDNTFVFPENIDIVEKIKLNKTYLNQKEVGQGIIPALDAYFIVEDPSVFSQEERKYIVPFHTGILDKYICYPIHKYLIYMSAKNFHHQTLQGFPNLKEHFSPHKQELIEAKIAYGTPNKPYFFVHRERDEMFFKNGEEKIVTQIRCEYPKFYYTKDAFYGSRALFYIKTSRFSMKCLTGILNSKVVHYWLKNNGKKQGQLLKLDKDPLLQIPLPLMDNNIVPIMTQLVDRILSAKKANPQADTTAEEREIDRLVYKLYDLTEDEIKIIESSLQ